MAATELVNRIVEIDASKCDPEHLVLLQEANTAARKLEAEKLPCIDPEWDRMPKMVWKLLSTHQSLIYRSVEIHNGIATLVNAGNLLGGAILARAQCETAAFISNLSHCLEAGIAQKNLQAVDDAIVSANFAHRWDKDDPKYFAKNILTLLERMDAQYFGSKKDTMMTWFYEALSEFAHPNWLGTMGFFGSIDFETRVHHFSHRPKDMRGVEHSVLLGASAIMISEDLLKRVRNAEQAVGHLSLDALKAST